ncbi:glycosyltransferase family 2 protein [Roseiflexus castenholzii]|uniref:glycosyltransferase family 2 protein n=1 Tax=Roseiflexus castenholzii TaxID=120962 RepID=UPI003C7ECCB8
MGEHDFHGGSATNRRDASASPASAIPTDDPHAALAFCRRLAGLIADHSVNGAAKTPQPQPHLSVVMPVFNERENLPALYERLTRVLDSEGQPYELVFVDDGSRDGSRDVLLTLAARDPRVVVVELARNFGHQIAISAGLDHARGDGVIVMDSDLQDPPEVLPQFIARWREGYDVVYAVRASRKENLLLRVAYAFFYRMLRRIANIDIPLDAGDFCLMDRRVVDILTAMPERNRFVRGIRSWVGMRQIGLPYDRQGRHAGKPKYTLSRLTYLALDGIVSFSFVPLRIITMLGFLVSTISIALAIVYAVQRIAFGLTPPGFPTLIVAIFFLSGIQLITIGVIGEYVGRIFEEVKQRPLYVVRRVVGGE